MARPKYRSFTQILASWTLIAASCWIGILPSQSEANQWDTAASGEHSFRQLGDDFSVSLPMKKVEGAKLVLFNHAAAKRLGLPIPSDPKELEKVVLKHFGYMVAPEGETGDKTHIATKYQDSGDKEEGKGGARGDGRSVWTGELDYKRPDGRLQAVDFSTKGVGVTPLAWFAHSDEGHKDGLQTMNEAVYSFIMSEANVQNQLDSSIDLAVIEVPIVKDDHKKGTRQNAAITVRVGNNTRAAHMRFHQDNPENLRSIFNYSVNRDLGRAPEHRVSGADVEKYLDTFSKNMANEAARYFDLQVAHGSPTPGNRTTGGGTVDMGTFRYLDGHHSEYGYLFNRLKLGKQDEQMKGYIPQMLGYLQGGDYPLPPSVNKAALIRTFDQQFEATLTRQWLHRVGMDEEAIENVMKHPNVAHNFYVATRKMHEAKGTKPVKYDRRQITPAAYDMRNVFSESLIAVKSGTDADNPQWSEAFKNKNSWATPEGPKGEGLRQFYVNSLAIAVKTARAGKKGPIDPNWIKTAQEINAHKRMIREDFVQKIENPMLEQIASGAKQEDLTAQAEAAIASLVDPGIAKNEWINSTPIEGSALFQVRPKRFRLTRTESCCRQLSRDTLPKTPIAQLNQQLDPVWDTAGAMVN